MAEAESSSSSSSSRRRRRVDEQDDSQPARQLRPVESSRALVAAGFARKARTVGAQALVSTAQRSTQGQPAIPPDPAELLETTPARKQQTPSRRVGVSSEVVGSVQVGSGQARVENEMASQAGQDIYCAI
ncbi:hypothetical protein CKAH01_03226 [Colletotrichum kahawae]|uniref:Uncharacterized protein n=1 Tax=Colletotrichum kahawae TaxID=34407 RepID=A0AAD9YX02_COLKA|nr:hypothetical protein CKAH01_03226 [Colletotrichum kahawae]